MLASVVVVLMAKLQERCPLKYNLVKGAQCLNPLILKSWRNSGKLDLALKEFVHCKRMSGEDADKVKDAYLKLANDPSVINVGPIKGPYKPLNTVVL